jgi:hypothetical protein
VYINFYLNLNTAVLIWSKEHVTCNYMLLRDVKRPVIGRYNLYGNCYVNSSFGRSHIHRVYSSAECMCVNVMLFMYVCMQRVCVCVRVHERTHEYAIYHQCSKWKLRSAGILIKSETRLYHQKNGKHKWLIYILIKAFICIPDVLLKLDTTLPQPPLQVFPLFVLSQ